jgi:MATE family multidrug resistance protein
MDAPKSTAQAPAEPVAAELTYVRVFAISFPIIISNVTTPLLGVTHTAVVGQLGEAHLIGAVALGATVFTLLFWAFGFLRMGTTGLTAQADGARKPAAIATVLGQALLLGGAAGLALIILQMPIELVALEMFQASAATETELQDYFAIRIWSAPFALINYVFLGWFIGLAKTRTALWLQVILNGLNVVLSVAFVSWAGWGVSGVAISTLIAEIAAAAVGAKLAIGELGQRGTAISWALVGNLRGLKRMAQVNSDLMIRTLCLLFAMTLFTAEAAKSGDDILAANAILLQFLGVSAYLLDGFAFATEALVGGAIGASTRSAFHRAIRLSSV